MRRHAVAGRIGRDTASAGSRSAPAGLARPCPGRRPAARRRGGGTREGALTPALSQGERGRDEGRRPHPGPLPGGEGEGPTDLTPPSGRGGGRRAGGGPDLSWGLSQGRGRTETLA